MAYRPTPTINFQYTADKTPSVAQTYLNAQNKWAEQDYQKQVRNQQDALNVAKIKGLGQQNDMRQFNIDEKELDKKLGALGQQLLAQGIPENQVHKTIIKKSYELGGKAYGDKQKASAMKNVDRVFGIIGKMPTPEAKLKVANKFAPKVGGVLDIENLSPEDLVAPNAKKIFENNGYLTIYDTVDNEVLKTQDILTPGQRDAMKVKSELAEDLQRSKISTERARAGSYNRANQPKEDKSPSRELTAKLWSQVEREAEGAEIEGIKVTPEQKERRFASLLRGAGYLEESQDIMKSGLGYGKLQQKREGEEGKNIRASEKIKTKRLQIKLKNTIENKKLSFAQKKFEAYDIARELNNELVSAKIRSAENKNDLDEVYSSLERESKLANEGARTEKINTERAYRAKETEYLDKNFDLKRMDTASKVSLRKLMGEYRKAATFEQKRKTRLEESTEKYTKEFLEGRVSEQTLKKKKLKNDIALQKLKIKTETRKELAQIELMKKGLKTLELNPREKRNYLRATSRVKEITQRTNKLKDILLKVEHRKTDPNLEAVDTRQKHYDNRRKFADVFLKAIEKSSGKRLSDNYTYPEMEKILKSELQSLYEEKLELFDNLGQYTDVNKFELDSVKQDISRLGSSKNSSSNSVSPTSNTPKKSRYSAFHK